MTSESENYLSFYTSCCAQKTKQIKITLYPIRSNFKFFLSVICFPE